MAEIVEEMAEIVEEMAGIVEEMVGIVEEEDSGEEIRSSHLGQGMETGVSYLKKEDGKEERRL